MTMFKDCGLNLGVLIDGGRNCQKGEAPEDCWRKISRLTREEFYDLVEQLSPYISTNFSSPNYCALSVERNVAVTLYYLKYIGSWNMTANASGLIVCRV